VRSADHLRSGERPADCSKGVAPILIDLMVNASGQGRWVAAMADNTGVGDHAVTVIGLTPAGEVVIIDPAGSLASPGLAVRYRLTFADFLDAWTGEAAYPIKP
jgi:hypothetical protein